jgi:hypothetical protein
VIEQAGLEGAFPVGLIGSAYKAGEVFLAPLRRRIAQSAPDAQISPVELAPVGGSLLLAAKACGQDGRIDTEHLTTLIERALEKG